MNQNVLQAMKPGQQPVFFYDAEFRLWSEVERLAAEKRAILAQLRRLQSLDRWPVS